VQGLLNAATASTGAGGGSARTAARATASTGAGGGSAGAAERSHCVRGDNGEASRIRGCTGGGDRLKAFAVKKSLMRISNFAPKRKPIELETSRA
jgi:hypothetical protein